ncbi:MAG TPA: hypothetical protein VJB57_16075 [Dehalococcoidia bacterium]|nr:hypothetical protein [Dehalococcoidia bacterium]
MKRLSFHSIIAIVAALALATGIISVASSANWGAPVSLGALNTPALEGCPIESPDGLSFYFASDRPGGVGGIDIWIAQRTSVTAPWGAAVNAGSPVNSSADDFCPTPTDGGYLYFVSARAGGCGGADIYRARFSSVGKWASYETLGCQVNSPAAEFSPALVREGSDTVLYFSSARAGGFAPEEGGAAPDHDIYASRMLSDGSFAAPVLVPGVNSAADDARPNVRLDGLELVFDSTRPGGQGGPDIWVSSRQSAGGSWSVPVNAGAPINSAAGESRPSLSRSGDRLYFGSTRPGGQGNSDVYVSSRDGAPAPVALTTASSAPPIRPPSTGDAGLAPRANASVEESGWQELRKWWCLTGAMEEMGHKTSDHHTFLESWLMNSNKTFAIYNPR